MGTESTNEASKSLPRCRPIVFVFVSLLAAAVACAQSPSLLLTHSTRSLPNPKPLSQTSAATAAEACRALALVFQAAGSRGELEGEEAAEEEEDELDEARRAERSYRRWLRARFADHARRLRSLLGAPPPSASSAGWRCCYPVAQAAAARAALEASRSAVTGKLDAGLFGSCLDALLLSDAAVAAASPVSETSPASPASSPAAPAAAVAAAASSSGNGASAEAVSVILSKAGFVDVRHSLLKSLARCAAALAASFASVSAPSSSSSSSSNSSPSASLESLSDAASTLVDVLIRVPALPERKAAGEGEDGNGCSLLSAESWCGAEAVGKASAASGGSGSRERRKRKHLQLQQQQQQQQGKGSGNSSSNTSNNAGGVSWAIPREHRRAARLAWQAVLLLPSPSLLPADALSSALRSLPEALKGMDRPALLCDALTDAVSGGGGNGGLVAEGEEGREQKQSSSLPSPSSPSLFSASAHATAVAALAALFELIVRHGLEYPVSWLFLL